MADEDTWDTETFEPEAPKKKATVADKWDGEDEDDEIKDNWDEEEEEDVDGELKAEEKAEAKAASKKKLSDKIKEKEELQRKIQEDMKKKSEESKERTELRPEVQMGDGPTKPDLELPENALGVSNNVAGIDTISPTTRDDFTEFEKRLKNKLAPFENSIHYPSLLESLFRDLCLSLEVDDLKKINSSITVLLSEKQKQEKQQLKGGKKKKKGVTPAGGFKAKMKDDLADYGEFDGGYTQDYEDFI